MGDKTRRRLLHANPATCADNNWEGEMDFYIEHNKRQKCWRIYDLRHEEKMEAVCLMTIGDSLMDRYLQALLITNGVLEIKDYTPIASGE